jgi:hypothetical protein
VINFQDSLTGLWMETFWEILMDSLMGSWKDIRRDLDGDLPEDSNGLFDWL